MLQLYNTLNRRKEDFEPLVDGKVSLYVCGITVYDYCHIGHARMWVVFDQLYRHLLASGYTVNFIRNITDIDDKIIARAAENGEDVSALTARFIDAMHEDERALKVLEPSAEPRATDTIAEMIALIEQLIAGGHAYAADNGDVYYAVDSFPRYGRLSGKKPDELRAGERVAIDDCKHDPLDFVLWKAAKPGEPAWDSPWGKGRPGWHIECSAMSMKLLGESFDIHGGGMDLQFPHHENEIAQSEAATGKRFARYWLHNGFVRVDDEKMSKSLGNFFTVRDVLARYSGEEIRFFITNSHYRSPLNFSDEQLDAARAGLRRLYTALRDRATEGGALMREMELRFLAAMDDDLNTVEAIAVLFEVAGELNRCEDPDQAVHLAYTLKTLGARLGFLQDDPTRVLQSRSGSAGGDGLDDAAIDALIEERAPARATKNWARSDEIRDQLAAAGIVLEDAGGRTSWRRE